MTPTAMKLYKFRWMWKDEDRYVHEERWIVAPTVTIAFEIAMSREPLPYSYDNDYRITLESESVYVAGID